MKKQLLIELDAAWVLKHREDDELPIDAIKKGLHTAEEIEVLDKTLTSLTLALKDETAYDRLCDEIKGVFFKIYPQDNIEDILSLSLCEAEPEEPVSKESAHQEDAAPAETQENHGAEEVLREISCLVGAEEFKSLAKDLVAIAPEVKKKKLQSVLFSQNYLFSIGDGCGLTTYLKLLAKLIEELDLLTTHPIPVVEERLAPFKENMEPFADVFRILVSDGNKLKILCVDISEWMGKTEHPCFKNFLKTVEKYADKFIVIFRIPFVEKDVLEGLKLSLNDLICIKTVTFPPLNYPEIKICAEKEIESWGYTVSKNAWSHFRDRIFQEKSDGRFYGLNTVKKVSHELIYNKLLDNARRKNPSDKITANDTKRLSAFVQSEGISGSEELNDLIGNEKIKKQLDEIIAQIELAIREKDADRPCIHMRFVGNPGTGKTTVARIVGKILKEKGVLRIGNFYEYKGRDLCGRYIGETAPKTASICRDAYGSVLFIDEAYSLYRGDGNDRDYGREALDTLIAEMENHRSDFVVIMAGYTDDMAKLMEGNRGLASRMPYTIEFPNFTRDELYQIYVSMVKKKFRYEDDLFPAVKDYFDSIPEETLSSKEFSNARFVRNLFERTWAKAAMRSQLGEKKTITLTKDDFERASCEKDFVLNNRKKTMIGF